MARLKNTQLSTIYYLSSQTDRIAIPEANHGTEQGTVVRGFERRTDDIADERADGDEGVGQQGQHRMQC